MLLKIVSVMNLILILSHLFNIQGREPYLCDFVQRTRTVPWYSDICGLISFKSGVIIETSKLYILISVWITLTFIEDLSCMRNQ